MPRYGSQPMTLSLPPMTRAAKWLAIVNLVIFVAIELLALGNRPLANFLRNSLALVPFDVVRGWACQLVTYAFVHDGIWQLVFNLLGIWFIGSLVEGIFGTRRFLHYYLICVLGAALATIALGYSGATPIGPVFRLAGAVGAIYGLLLAVGMLMGETEFTLLPFPIQIKAKYLVWITIIVAVLMSLGGPGAIMRFGELGGMIAGFIYLRFFYGAGRRPVPAYAIGRGLADRSARSAPVKRESWFAAQFNLWRNSYHRWRRKHLARKFEVYMRKHDRKVYFDEHGNCIDPDSAE